MGLFQHKVKSSIKEQMKSLFSRNPIPRKENAVSKASEDASQVNPFELKVIKNSGRSYGDRIQRLPSKRSSGFNQSKRNNCQYYVGKAPEFGDSKVNSHHRKYKCSSKCCSSVDTDSRNSSATSHYDRKNYSNINHPTFRSRTRSVSKRSLDAQKRSESRKSGSLVDKSAEKSKINYNKWRQYSGEPLKKTTFSNQSRSSPQNVVQQYSRRNTHQSIRRHVNSCRMPRGSNFYGARRPKSRNEYYNESINQNKIQCWSSTSFSSDVSMEFWKRRNTINNQKGNLKSHTWMLKPKKKTYLPADKKRTDSQYDNISVENRTHMKQTLRICSQFQNKHYETKRDKSSRSIKNSSYTVVDNKRNTGIKSERMKSSMKYAQENNKTVFANTLCPQKKHEILSSDKPCVCMKIEKMKFLQAGSVVYEWHKTEAKAADGKDVKIPESSPSLDDFKLMSPAKVSTGGQGTVAWVHLPNTTMQYALKFKYRHAKSDKTWIIERREAKLLQKVKHSFIVDTYHIYETDSALFMAFEYLSGGCLWHHIARIGVLPEGYAVYYAACILTALSYLHERGIVYRDMKAENIVLDYQHRPKLIDFGMAKYFPSVKREMRLDGSRENNQSSESPVGKEILHRLHSYWASPDIDSDDEVDDPPTRYYYAAYLAPEIYEMPTESNQFIDSWGLGYLILEMVLGYGIFRPIPWASIKGQHLNQEWKLYLPPNLLKKLTPRCRSLIFKMLIRQPQSRLSVKEAMRHSFFCRVPWTNLYTLPGPDLSKFQNPEEFHQHHSKNIFDNFDQKPKFFTAKKSHNPHPIYWMIYKPRMRNRRDTCEFTSNKTNPGKQIEEVVATHRISGSRKVNELRNDRMCYLENNVNGLGRIRNSTMNILRGNM